MVILEGCDGSGKSTLVKHISEYYGIDYFHSTGPGTEEELWERVKKYKIGGLYDRFTMISEVVYAGALKRQPKFSVKDLNSFLTSYKPLIIYCRPPLKQILSNVHEGRPEEDRKHVAEVNNKLCQIYFAYETIMVQLEHHVWDFQNSSSEYANILLKLCGYQLECKR